MANERRTFRIAEEIRELVAEMLQRVADPRFHMVTVTSVALSPDMRLAKVYWVVSQAQGNLSRKLNGPAKDPIGDAAEAFASAEGLFKRAVSKKLKSSSFLI